MTDCGESIGSVHRCGDCGEDTYARADLEKLWDEFNDCDWPDKSISAFFDWLQVRASVGSPDALPVGMIPLRPDLGEEGGD